MADFWWPRTVTTNDDWDLRATGARDASYVWRSIASSLSSEVNKVWIQADDTLNRPWTGDAAESYRFHRDKLKRDVDEAEVQAKRIADELSAASDAIEAAQSRLADNWNGLNDQIGADRENGGVTWHPHWESEVAEIEAALGIVAEIRADLDVTLAQHQRAIETGQRQLADLAGRWAAVADGDKADWTPPAESTEPGVLYYQDWRGWHAVISTGSGDDVVEVRNDPDGQGQLITVNGVPYRTEYGTDYLIRTGNGNDTITVAPGTNAKLTLIGGAGNDRITGSDEQENIIGLGGDDVLVGGTGRLGDRITGGGGKDRITGSQGYDHVIAGGGDDTVYGLAGSDSISGNAGDDYIDGGEGYDDLTGDAGRDTLSGGDHDDRLYGGDDDDTLIAGTGKDKVYGDDGNDKAIVEQADAVRTGEQVVRVQIKDVGTFINVKGSPEFVGRIQSDLDTIRATPSGQQLLSRLDADHTASKEYSSWWTLHRETYGGDTLTIQEAQAAIPSTERVQNVGYNSDGDTSFGAFQDRDDTYINVDATVGAQGGPPVTGVARDLNVAYQYTHGIWNEGVHGEGPEIDTERMAVGLPIDDDHDDNIGLDNPTPQRISPEQPYDMTENSIRDDLGLPRQTTSVDDR